MRSHMPYLKARIEINQLYFSTDILSYCP